MKKRRNGMIIVYTGKGKGKSTAAFGLLMRAIGQGLRPCVIQFIKTETGRWGEVKTAQNFGIEWHQMGDGFTWQSKDIEESKAKAEHGWKLAKEKIASGDFDIVVLDEFTYTLHFEWFDTDEIINWLKENKPPNVHIVITGRYAPDALIAYADLVTEMTNIKHPFDQGHKAQRGIEF